MTNVLVVGYGNVGKKVVQAVLKESDLNLVAIQEVFEVEALGINVPIVKSMEQVKEKIDVAILSIPSLSMPAVEAELLAKGINTVDSFDIHSKVRSTKEKLGKIAKENNSVSIMSAGWDPGSDSVMRVLMEAMVPKGVTYTNFGPGMSMGHTVVVRKIEGVEGCSCLNHTRGLVQVFIEGWCTFN